MGDALGDVLLLEVEMELVARWNPVGMFVGIALVCVGVLLGGWRGREGVG